MSLHQRLIHDASRTGPPELTGLTDEEKAAWNGAVEAYRSAAGEGSMTFARPMTITSDALTQVADDAAELFTDAPMKDALVVAAFVYRSHWWVDDDRGSRFFIAYAAGMLREAGTELVRRHEKAYGAPWPSLVRAYITPFAGEYGAYTIVGRAGGVITTMSCRDEGYQGLHALEMLLHESSHAIVNPNSGPVGSSIVAAAKAHGIPPPRNLWHAILFMTSSELTRRVLAERGITGFVPSSEDLFTRAWPQYRDAVEKHWIAYLDGVGTLEEAIDSIVGDVPR